MASNQVVLTGVERHSGEVTSRRSRSRSRSKSSESPDGDITNQSVITNSPVYNEDVLEIPVPTGNETPPNSFWGEINNFKFHTIIIFIGAFTVLINSMSDSSPPKWHQYLAVVIGIVCGKD